MWCPGGIVQEIIKKRNEKEIVEIFRDEMAVYSMIILRGVANEYLKIVKRSILQKFLTS